MSADNFLISDFFDSALTRFRFLTVKPSHKQDLSNPPTLTSPLVCQDLTTEQLRPGVFALYGKLIVYFENEKATLPQACLDISYARLRHLSTANDDECYGFVIAKNGWSFAFYSGDEEIIKTWVTALKSVCILTNFHEQYSASKLIGKGGFAKVFLIKSKETGKRFAAKTFEKNGSTPPSRASLLNEIDLMRSLDHENIIKLHEVHETKGSIYFVLELGEGRSLQEIMDDPSFAKDYPEEKIISIIRSILEGLSYLAFKGIMHRDLKPENILINEKIGEAKIVDFGLATKIDVPDYIFKICGSPGYIAPEVFTYNEKEAETFYNDRCDVFSAGCIFFQMLLKYPLFDNQDPQVALRQNMDLHFLKGVKYIIKNEVNNKKIKFNSQGLDLLQKLMEFDKNKRISASELLNHPYIKRGSRTYFKPKQPKLLLLGSFGDESQNSPVNTSDAVGTIVLNDKVDSLQVCVSWKKSEKLEALSPLSPMSSTDANTFSSAVSSKPPAVPAFKISTPRRNITTPKAPRNAGKCVKVPIWPITEHKEDEPKEEEKPKEGQLTKRNKFLPSIKPMRSPKIMKVVIPAAQRSS